MKMGQSKEVLKKFYDGESSLEEEKLLKREILNSDEETPEKDYFRFTQKESRIPESLEADIFAALNENLKTRKIRIRRLYSLVAVAASLILFFGIYIEFQKTKNQKMADTFFQMEQALFQVSETLKPQKADDMVVLWVDNNVEIIVN
jgi:hypothetical protein